MKFLAILVSFLFVINAFACRMTESAFYNQRTIAAINTLNNVDEVLTNIAVNPTSTKLTFRRIIVGSVFCVEREIKFIQEPNCDFTLESKQDTFIKMDNCLEN